MRIDWFSPLPPARTAIADYTARLLAALSAQAEVTLWTSQPHWHSSLESHAAVRRFDPHAIRWDELHAADAIFYNIGNNAEFHQAIWQVARRSPGFAIMHDVLMHDSISWDHQQRNDRGAYLDLMQSLYGARGLRDGALYWEGVLTRLQMGRVYSCAPFLLEASLGAIVHSRAAGQALLKEVDVPVERLPLPFPAGRPPAPSNVPAPPWKLVVFGFLGANRCLEQILSALARLADRRFQLHIYGSIEERAAVEAAIERLRLADAVTLHGFVTDAELDAALASAQLVLNLRYPTKGEASYSQLRIWSHGLPSLVSQIGWYAEQPADTVFFVRPHFLEEDVCAHLRAFAARPAAYQAAGMRGYDHLLEQHSPRAYAARIVELAGQAPEYRKRWNARRMSGRAVEGLQGWFPAARLEGYTDHVGSVIRDLTGGPAHLASGRHAETADTAGITGMAAVPVCPEGLNVDALFRSVPDWHQQWEIFQNVFTPGRNSVATLMARAAVPADLTGMRVLDVGAFNCCCSFECERRGAAEVVALDLQDPAALGFPVLREALGSTRVRFVQASVYNLDPETLGKFDVVLFFGVLYHLRYPLLAIDQLRRIARGRIYIESLVIDHRFIEGGRDLQELASYHPALPEIPLWQFYKTNELEGDYSNWFGPNIRAVLDAFESAGLPAQLTGAWGDRATFQATAGGRGHIGQSYEGMSELIRQQLGLER